MRQDKNADNDMITGSFTDCIVNICYFSFMKNIVFRAEQCRAEEQKFYNSSEEAEMT